MAVIMNYAFFGQNIRKHRKAQKLTQEVLAERAGVCYQFLGHLERGNGVPSVHTVMSLCEALSITPNDLLLNSAIPDPNPPCRLRDDNSVFDHTLTDNLFPEDEAAIDVQAWLDQLPDFDIILPDIDGIPSET